jgi:chromate reductase
MVRHAGLRKVAAGTSGFSRLLQVCSVGQAGEQDRTILMHILAISGSLRLGSSNTTLLRALNALAPAGCDIRLYDSLADIPAFNPDLDDAAPPPVLDFRDRLREADGVLISSPEYAHGVSGVMKNVLDWVVGSGELSRKPVALLNAAPWTNFAQGQLLETLRTMDAHVVEAASVTVTLLPKTIDAAGIAAHPEIAPILRAALDAFAQSIVARQEGD